jgi:nucleoside-diphosphate-sugar epimerase
MKIFVTGGTGFIGQRVVRKLIERGHQVQALVRSHQGAAALEAMGAQPVWGDITASESMYDAMRGSGAVFHLAGWYKIGARDAYKAESINVQGTKNVLELAFNLKVPRIFYTSTIAIYGDTHGAMPDESYIPPNGPFLTEYDRTKYLAHYQVALPLIQRGAPITILMPGVVYGPQDTSLVGQMMKLFYRGLFPVLPGPELTLTYAHVEDIAEGHILALEKGRPGEVYHLTGPALNLGQAVNLWAEVSGQRKPYFSIPARFVKPFLPVVTALGNVLPLPAVVSRDTLAILDASYQAKPDKAIAELGWTRKPLKLGFRETFETIAQSPPAPLLPPISFNRRKAAAMALGAGIGVLVAWLWLRQRGKQVD